MPTSSPVRIDHDATIQIFEVKPTLDTVAYTAGDTLFVTTEILNAFIGSHGNALLHSVCINDKDDVESQIDLVFLRSNTNIGIINNAPSIADASADEIIAIVPCSTMYDMGGCRILIANTVGQTVYCSSGQSLWVAGITRGAPTHSAAGLTIKIGLASR